MVSLLETQKFLLDNHTCQPNRILTHKTTHIRLVIPEEVVMKPRFTVGILVLKAEGLVSTVRYSGFFFQTAPTSVVAKPNQIAVLIGHFSWDADVVAVEVVGLLAVFSVFGCPIADLRQRFVGIRVGVDIGIPAVRLDFLQEVATVLNEVGLVFEPSKKQKLCANHIHSTSGLKALCGLRLATHATSKLEVSRRLKPVSCEDSTIRDINFPSI